MKYKVAFKMIEEVLEMNDTENNYVICAIQAIVKQTNETDIKAIEDKIMFDEFSDNCIRSCEICRVDDCPILKSDDNEYN